MINIETATLQLFDALPDPGDRHELQVHGGCPAANDASGTKAKIYEAAALDPGVAKDLIDKTIYSSHDTVKRVAEAARYRDTVRVGEHIACLLTRAQNLCPQYDAIKRRERTEDEALLFLRRTHA